MVIVGVTAGPTGVRMNVLSVHIILLGSCKAAVIIGDIAIDFGCSALGLVSHISVVVESHIRY